MIKILSVAPFLILGGVGAAADVPKAPPPPKQIHVDFVLRQPNFTCQGNRTIDLGSDVVFCDEVVEGKHVQFHVTIKPDEKASFLLKGSVEEIGEDGAVSRVNELGIRALAGEPAEIQSGDLNKSRDPHGHWTDWTVQADPIL